jgi:hypothetical protein
MTNEKKQSNDNTRVRQSVCSVGNRTIEVLVER